VTRFTPRHTSPYFPSTRVTAAERARAQPHAIHSWGTQRPPLFTAEGTRAPAPFIARLGSPAIHSWGAHGPPPATPPGFPLLQNSPAYIHRPPRSTPADLSLLPRPIFLP
jgi:hypothetical protein